MNDAFEELHRAWAVFLAALRAEWVDLALFAASVWLAMVAVWVIRTGLF